MDLVIRAVAIYILVFAFTRIVGRRELSTVIGDLVQSGVTQNDLSVTGVVLVITTIGLLQVFTSYLGFRFRRVRRMLQGEPIVLVHAGEVFEQNLRRERLDVDDLAEKARLNGISAIEDVQWAVLENNGDISFIKKADG
jgi:uncharacterized membrane protein YcaP (DUF421 family)